MSFNHRIYAERIPQLDLSFQVIITSIFSITDKSVKFQ